MPQFTRLYNINEYLTAVGIQVTKSQISFNLRAFYLHKDGIIGCVWLVYLNKQLIGIHFITTQLPNDCVSGNRPDMNHMDVVCQPAPALK